MGVNIINNVYEGVLKVIKFLVVLLSIVLVVVVFANVISRYFLNFSLAWSTEAARFLFIWVSFMGAVLANDRSEHMKLDILIKKTSPKAGKIISIAANVIILVILGLLLKGGVTIVIENYSWLTSAMEISYGLVYSIVPFCIVILMLQTLARIFVISKSLLGFSQSDQRGANREC